MKYLYWLLAFIPITIAARYGFHLSDGIVFWLCCVGIVPLAAVLGDATEQARSRLCGIGRSVSGVRFIEYQFDFRRKSMPDGMLILFVAFQPDSPVLRNLRHGDLGAQYPILCKDAGRHGTWLRIAFTGIMCYIVRCMMFQKSSQIKNI